jgi:hypothetical protein
MKPEYIVILLALWGFVIVPLAIAQPFCFRCAKWKREEIGRQCTAFRCKVCGK